jgi:hypothetical protein
MLRPFPFHARPRPDASAPPPPSLKVRATLLVLDGKGGEMRVVRARGLVEGDIVFRCIICMILSLVTLNFCVPHKLNDMLS